MNTNNANSEQTAVHNEPNQAAITEALKQIGANQHPQKTRHVTQRRTLLWLYLTALLAFGLTYRYIPYVSITTLQPYYVYLQHICLAGLLISAILTLAEFLIIYWLRTIPDEAFRYNFIRLIWLFVSLAIIIVVISVIFVNWKTALLSLGVLSVILGLALQAVLGNLFAWFYILIRKPYRIGDRIRINDAAGDVIDVGYFDTTLWEFGGQYLSSDHPSGRIIKFPNSLVFSQAVYNYSWPLFPYIWNEVRVYVAYGSELEFVAEIMSQAAMEEIGDDMAEHVNAYRRLLARTPVDEIEVNEKPVVLFRTNENTWIEAIVRYVVEPKQAGSTKTRILKKCLERLGEQPDKVLFPKGDNR